MRMGDQTIQNLSKNGVLMFCMSKKSNVQNIESLAFCQDGKPPPWAAAQGSITSPKFTVDYKSRESMIIVIYPLRPSHLVSSSDIISQHFHISGYFIYIITCYSKSTCIPPKAGKDVAFEPGLHLRQRINPGWHEIKSRKQWFITRKQRFYVENRGLA